MDFPRGLPDSLALCIHNLHVVYRKLRQPAQIQGEIQGLWTGFRGRNHQRVEWNLEQVLVQCQDPSRFALELRIQPAKKIAVKLLTQCSRY